MPLWLFVGVGRQLVTICRAGGGILWPRDKVLVDVVKRHKQHCKRKDGGCGNTSKGVLRENRKPLAQHKSNAISDENKERQE